MSLNRSRRLATLRWVSQLVFLGLFILACLVSFDIYFEFNPSLKLFSSLAARSLAGEIGPAVAFILITAVLGRFFCGWICPMGAMIDAVGALRGRRNGWGDRINGLARIPKFALWALIAAFAVAGIQLAWMLDPIAIAGKFMSLAAFPAAAYLLDGFFRITGSLPLVGGWLEDAGRGLPLGDAGARIYGRGAIQLMAGIFALAAAISLWKPRLWCRSICPLGALYAVVGRFAPIARRTDACTGCGICSEKCRMGAIRKDGEYEKGECILCMDCIYDCPTGKTVFGFRDPKKREPARGGHGITRAQFLAITAVPLAAGLASRRALAGVLPARLAGPIRPPGSAGGGDIGRLCVRCGNCMNVCPTNVIQPRMAGAGLEDLWTPVMEYSTGYCEYNCTKCGESCPTDAILELPIEVKRRTILGLAVVDREKCIPWKYGDGCLVCEEHCPIPDKAIKKTRKTVGGKRVECPTIDASLCIGCGICQNKCPADPVAITVGPVPGK